MANRTRADILSFGLPLLLAVLLALSFVLPTRVSNVTIQPSVPAGGIPITAPATSPVGNSAQVTVGPVAAPDGTPVSLVALDTWGPRLWQETLQGGTARFTIPPQDTRRAGSVTLVATVGGASGQAELSLVAGPVASPVTPQLGATRLVADGQQTGLALVTPLDELGNPVADGTLVHVVTAQPGNRVSQQDVPVANLVARAPFRSGTLAGSTEVTARVGAMSGPEVRLDEVPGWPTALAIHVSPLQLPADGQSWASLTTDPLQDQQGNLVADGTRVTFISLLPDGSQRLVPAETVDGVASAALRAPTTAGQLSVRAEVYGVQSTAVNVVITPGPAVGSFPISATEDQGTGLLRLSMGPLLGDLGQYVSDGTLVSIQLVAVDGSQQAFTAPVRQGRASLDVPLAGLPPGLYEVRASAGSGTGSAFVRVAG